MNGRSAARVLLAGAAVVAALGLVATPASATTTGASGPPRAVASTARLAEATTGCTGAGTLIPQRPPALAQLQASTAWEQSRGAGIVVAVVDSGVDAANPHLASVLAGGTDLVGDGAGAAGYADGYGHGTAIAGEIAAQTVDGSGVEGLAPDARILSVRVFAGTDDQAVAAGSGPSIARLAAGIRYAADAHAQVINVSLSTAVDDPALREAVAYATAHGSLIVASSGNRDSSLAVEKDQQDGVRYPAGYPGVLGVAAIGTGGAVTDDSIHGAHVALSAPGQDVLTAASTGGDCVYASDAPATSFATAYVSAAAALVASAHPDETPAEWAYRLMASAIRAHPGSRDDDAGWGVVQPYEAIVLVPGAETAGPTNPFTASTHAPAASESPALTVQPNDDSQARQSAAAVVVSVIGLTILAAIAAVGILAARRRRARREGTA
ncbi:type VII secretion-associated serine protease [Leifsonia sp. LS1]|uniref:S8 family serine peptidase n=1 Tax=Leifsonia sp. LS1 TaxID=2828483 RepID=UPI001CFDD8C9|nr:S8 family serine peptidase [Leifsonia sp. LS1]GIT82112.1 type VII secretion-associated serine protease [Leifsonia sp. LS1]